MDQVNILQKDILKKFKKYKIGPKKPTFKQICYPEKFTFQLPIELIELITHTPKIAHFLSNKGKPNVFRHFQRYAHNYPQLLWIDLSPSHEVSFAFNRYSSRLANLALNSSFDRWIGDRHRALAQPPKPTHCSARAHKSSTPNGTCPSRPTRSD